MKKILIVFTLSVLVFVLVACTDVTTTMTSLLTSQTSSQTTSLTTTKPPKTTTETTTTEPPVIDMAKYNLKDSKNFILAEVGEEINLSDYAYKGTFGEVRLTEGVFTNLPSGVTITDGILMASVKGSYKLTFTTRYHSVVILLFAKLPEDTEYIIFSANYDSLANGSLPEGYVINTGAASISNGKLLVDGQSKAVSRVLLPSYLDGFKNYIIETDFTILASNEPTRWASLMFRFSTAGYYQMAIRQGATSTNGVEFAKWINNDWNVPLTTSYTEAISSTKNYRLKVDVNGSVIKQYIDGNLMITYEGASEYANGSIGFQAKGVTAAYNNIVITLPEAYIEESSYEFKTIASLYEPVTNIQIPPVAIQNVYSVYDINDMSRQVRPQVLVMTVDSSGSVVNPLTGTYISPIIDALKKIDGLVIPAFNISNPDIAEDIATLLKDNKISDAFLFSDNVQAIQDARIINPMLRGVLCIDNLEDKPTLSETDLLEIRNLVNSSRSVAALLPVKYATKNNVEYLQRRLVSVFVDTSDGAYTEQYIAVMSGSNGLIVNELSKLYDFYFLFPENSLIRTPMIIGHRGMSSKAPENSLQGSILAYEAGAHVIELDIYLTTDNRLVVIHDATTTRTTNGTMTVENSTLAQLRTLTLLDYSGKYPGLPIPTLDDYFTEFIDKDVQIFIEIKSSKPEILPVLSNLIDAYDIGDQISVLSFIPAMFQNIRNTLPELSLGYLNNTLANVTDLNGSILSVLNNVVPNKTTFNPTHTTVTEDLVRQLNYRGITTWPWTINDNNLLYSFYTMGVGGITTDNTWKLSDNWLDYEANEYFFNVDLALGVANIPLGGIVQSLKKTTQSLSPKVILVEHGHTGILVSEGGFVSNLTATGTATLIVGYQSTFTNDYPYAIYDDLVVIKVFDSRLSSKPESIPPAIISFAFSPKVTSEFNDKKYHVI